MVTYLLLIHKSPNQFRRLVQSLKCDGVIFCVHVDKKCDMKDFTDVVPCSEYVYYVDERIDGKWGDFSLVEAAFSTMRLALSLKRKGHFVLLSGQDYPLRSNEYIREFFANHSQNNFMSVYPVPDPKKESENGGGERFVNWTFDCCNPRNDRMKAKITPFTVNLKTCAGFLRLLLYRPSMFPLACRKWFSRRIYPRNLCMLFNEFWCAFTSDAVEKLLYVYDTRMDVRNYYKYTHIPDETIFSSILCADKDFCDSLLPMCHYIDWDVNSKGSPKSLTSDDWSRMDADMKGKSYILFARKFEENSNLLNIIDKLIK